MDNHFHLLVETPEANLVTTDGSGVGQAVVPAAEAANTSGFFRMEER